MLGTLLGGWLSDFLSRRWCLLLTCPVAAAGWGAIALGSVRGGGGGVWPFYAGRMLTGMGTGAMVGSERRCCKWC